MELHLKFKGHSSASRGKDHKELRLSDQGKNSLYRTFPVYM